MLRPKNIKLDLIDLWEHRRCHTSCFFACVQKKPVIIQKLDHFINTLKYIKSNELSWKLKLDLGNIIFDYRKDLELSNEDNEVIKKIKFLVWGKNAAPIHRSCVTLDLHDLLNNETYNQLATAKDPESEAKRIYDAWYAARMHASINHGI